jgi:hypothetical protein
MESQSTSGWSFVSFVVGAAVGLGAGMLTARSLRSRFWESSSKKTGIRGSDSVENTHYCAVPEGADICYPE